MTVGWASELYKNNKTTLMAITPALMQLIVQNQSISIKRVKNDHQTGILRSLVCINILRILGRKICVVNVKSTSMQQFELSLQKENPVFHDVTPLRNAPLVSMFNKTTQHSYQTLK